jgi:alpha-N-arabinofuranosidase
VTIVTTSGRRDFLRQIAAAGVAVAPGWCRAHGAAAARATADTTRARAEIDRRLFGSFLEHLGRAVYEGVYEPGSRLADSNGYRKDVLEEMRTLGVPIMRYPGGNFVSGYNWLDGVGPQDKRPRVLERAWNSTETNQFGTNEFLAWCKLAGCEPLLAVNLGSGTAEMAAALAEYCLVDKGTKYSDLRRSHGVESPYEVKYWCLGNEMDGPWQIGHMTAREYGRKAADAARQMRVIDPSLKLIACGSSGPFMPTYLTWDREALEECYNEVDAISLHRYFNNTTETDGDPARYLALNLSLERQIEEVAATCDYVQGLNNSRKRLWLSFDEWNVWYRARVYDGKRAAAPHLLEEVYNLEDALLVGGLLNSLIRHAGRVRVACLAQIVNVIAPLLTNQTQVLRQSIYYPYAWALKHARGLVLDLLFESETYEVPQFGAVPYVDVVASFDPGTGRRCVLALNRDLKGDRELTVHWQDSGPSRAVTCETLTGSDLKAANSFDQPRRVVPQALEPPAPGSKMTLKLPPRSYTVAVMAS